MLETLVKTLQDFWANLLVGQIQQLGNWNYLFLALLNVIEGPLATLFGAMAASTGLLQPQWVFIAAAAGNLTADILWYLLGRLGTTGWLVRRGRWLGMHSRHAERFEGAMQVHGPKILLVAKLTLSFAVPALIAAGMARLPWRRWFSVVLAGEIIWTGSLVLIGYHFTLSIRRLEAGLQIVALVGIIIFVILAVRFIARRNTNLRLPF